jgi:hypothetical protein
VLYDAARRRLWIFGQRCHHGAGGVLVAAAGCLGLLGVAPARRPAVVALAAGGVMIAHDWKDRSFWFERGFGTQP